ncbi:MAG: hypothetical protein J6C19_12320 [Lachnospiraceae bacterium]|nr:hypothetical protein [Lachnospiraceae bacterium]
MVNQEAVKRAQELMRQYERNWGKRIESSHILPSGMTQEQFVTVLEHIVETGESVLVGYEKCFLD